MTVRKEKRHRKFRGRRTYHGSHKKWRGSGSSGGVGNAGWHKHKWTYAIKYEPEHFGKKGFKIPQAVKKEIKSINIQDLEKQAEKLLKEKIAEKQDEKIKINVMKLGYQKVLGSGRISTPMIVEAKYFSKQAIEKLEGAGGKAIKVG